MTLYDEIKERQPALLAAEELILDWTEQCPVLLSEKAHDALAERIAALAAENARLRKALRKAAESSDAHANLAQSRACKIAAEREARAARRALEETK